MDNTNTSHHDNPEQPLVEVKNENVDLPSETAEILNELPDDKRKIVIQSIKTIQQELFSGPLPHPRIMQGYEEVQKGFAERILKMAEKEQEHRITSDNAIVDATTSSNKRGQWMGFVIAVLFLIGAVTLGLFGQPWLGGIIGGGTLVSLVTVFVTNSRSKQSEAGHTGK